MSPTLGILTLRSATLRRVHPAILAAHDGGKKGVVVATARSEGEWCRLAREHFCLPLDEVLAREERTAVWAVVTSKHRAWLAEQRWRRAQRLAPLAVAALIAAAVVLVGSTSSRRRAR